ncbi:hypothetical protein F975_01166 [Acinetobacter sp. ANC 3789]|nr:hypothetical protein F975_01166 [Acinetobacter sp. ANC 3789]
MLGLNIKHLFSYHIFLQIIFDDNYAANYTQTDNSKFNLKIPKLAVTHIITIQHQDSIF